jgi:hypothetical protein
MKPQYVVSKTSHETTIHKGYCTNCHYTPIVMCYVFCPKCGCKVKHVNETLEYRVDIRLMLEGAQGELPSRIANLLYQEGFDLSREITQEEDMLHNKLIFKQSTNAKLLAYSEQEVKQLAIDAFLDRVIQPKKYKLNWTKGINREIKPDDWNAESEASAYTDADDLGEMGQPDNFTYRRKHE